MIFYALTSAGPRGSCGNASLKGEGFNTTRGAQQMLMYQNSMSDCYYCIKHFFRLKTLEKLLQKVLFTCTYNGQKSMLPWNVLKMLLPGQRLTSLLLNTLLMMTSVFMTAPECFNIRKTANPCINSMWIALLIHGLVLVKTWLLIACDTAFYGIIFISVLFCFSIIQLHKNWK